MGTALIIIGTWLLSDGIYSIHLYINAPSYEGSLRQTFKRDHWIRLIRIFMAVFIIIAGVLCR